MGYDMFWRQAPEGEDGYFRLNIFGMSRYRDLMAEFGMAFNDTPPPRWPRTEDFGLTDEEYWSVEYPEDYPDVQLDAVKRASAEKMLAEQDKVLKSHTKETPGIPLHKFSTNDGWIVLPVECGAAVKAWQTYCSEHGEAMALKHVGEPDRQSYWQQWIAYLADAARHDGFVVN